MAIRIEWIVILAIVSIVSLAYNYKISNQYFKKVSSSKELEFYDTVFSKVDTKSLINKINTKYGVLKNKTLTVESLIYQDTQISKLYANNGILDDDTLTLEGNVSLFQDESLEVYTQKAIYNKAKSQLIIPTQFLSKIQQDIIEGEELIYNINQKISTAINIKAKIKLDSKSKE
jgi:hypothetical protein